MDNQNYFSELIISALITLVVILVPYIITRIITKKKLQEKTSKIITVIFSVVSFIVFSILYFAADRGSVSIFPIILWNAVGYMIIKPNGIIPEKKQTKNDININATNQGTVSAENTLLQNSTITDTSIITEKRRHRSIKHNKAVIALSITTAIFCLATVGLTAGVIYLDTKLASVNEELTVANKEKNSLEHKLTTAQNQADSYFSEKNDLQKELFFYEAYAVCVNDDSPYYHKPECDYFDDSSFYIYNVDTARAKGYTECPYCY